MKNFSDEEIAMIWKKGQIVQNYDPNQYRKDEAGAWMIFSHYSNTNSIYGWEIDHILPVTKGGRDVLDNLQPLQWENNRTKGDNYPFYSFTVTSQGNKNISYSRF